VFHAYSHLSRPLPHLGLLQSYLMKMDVEHLGGKDLGEEVVEEVVVVTFHQDVDKL